VETVLDSGERLKRGCGNVGLVETVSGRRCLYCGNFIYGTESTPEDLWFHFKTGREYRRAATLAGVDFINGVPVIGTAEDLPGACLADLQEILPPPWFSSYANGGCLRTATAVAAIHATEKHCSYGEHPLTAKRCGGNASTASGGATN
jgi:hypothetical protein